MYQVESRTLEEQHTLVMRGKVGGEDIKKFLGDAFGGVATYMGMKGIPFAGPPFARYRPLDEAFHEFEVEAGFPVSLTEPGEGDVVASALPAGPAAVVIHVGPYDEMMPAYQAVTTWIEEQGGHAEGPAWEVYFSDPEKEPDPATWRTEIVQPYTK